MNKEEAIIRMNQMRSISAREHGSQVLIPDSEQLLVDRYTTPSRVSSHHEVSVLPSRKCYGAKPLPLRIVGTEYMILEPGSRKYKVNSQRSTHTDSTAGSSLSKSAYTKFMVSEAGSSLQDTQRLR